MVRMLVTLTPFAYTPPYSIPPPPRLMSDHRPLHLTPTPPAQGVSVSATMQPLLPSTLTKASTWSCMANCKPCKNITCCKNRGGCCYSWAKWLGCNTVKLSNGWKCKCPI